ncbi:MAG: aspartate-semialdehyde dehydrogenase [Chloroflexi bacterium]|nr:aspartate-semialdehyde dehydrogenase [Chloroflexota bacterium]
MNEKIPVAVLGATGLVGQRLVLLLDGHPWFQVRALAASDNSVGKRYADAVKWHLGAEIPSYARDMVVQPCEPAYDVSLVFSALPSDVAGDIEESFARAGRLVSSNAANHRMDADVPLVIPEVNPAHLDLVRMQRARRKSNGAIVCNPNCSTIHLTLALKPLFDAFGLRRVVVTTMQALSGAGYPGVASLDILDNVVPYIGGEEKKLESEPLKILGQVGGGSVAFADLKISAACNRVATSDGHLETASVEFVDKPAMEDVRRALAEFCGEPQQLNLPMAPAHPIVVRDEIDRPQPRLDRDVEKGMATVVGRLRACSVLDYKFALMGHNTIRGAAGGTLLNAELMVAKGLLN